MKLLTAYLDEDGTLYTATNLGDVAMVERWSKRDEAEVKSMDTPLETVRAAIDRNGWA